MKLDSVSIFNFRSFDQLDLPLGSRLTLLVGENGSGKSSVLDAISIGLGAIATFMPRVSGISFKRTDLRQTQNQLAPYMSVHLTSLNGLEWGRTEKRDGRASTTKEIPVTKGLSDLKRALSPFVLGAEGVMSPLDLPLFVYYGVSRALLDVPLRRRGFPKAYSRFQALEGALEADSRFRSAFMWFYHREQDELRLQRDRQDFTVQLPELAAVRKAIELTFPGIRNPHIDTNPLRFVVEQDGEKLDITQLSDGYKTMLALIIDLASRMALANPHLQDPLTAEVVVMIDEIDLHLHPQWQKRVVGDLVRVFPGAQFILTTHSPYIIESLNNHLQSFRSIHRGSDTSKGLGIQPIPASEIKAYVMGSGGATSMMDTEFGLMDNSLLEPFNELAVQFSHLQNDDEGAIN